MIRRRAARGHGGSHLYARATAEYNGVIANRRGRNRLIGDAMNVKRSLRLRKEVLAELAKDELAAVVGADALTIATGCSLRCASRQVVSCVVKCIPDSALC